MHTDNVPCSLYITNFRLTLGNFSSPAKAVDLELLVCVYFFTAKRYLLYLWRMRFAVFLLVVYPFLQAIRAMFLFDEEEVQRITRALRGIIESVEIHCKDVRKIELQLESTNPLAVPPLTIKSLKRTIKSVCFPSSITDVFAFSFKVKLAAI